MDASSGSPTGTPGIRGLEGVMFFVHDLERAKAFNRGALHLEPEEEEEDFASY
jgi:hypothetical protein